ncbi:MAG: complex I subunit 5 family protein [Suilimivivens sp.]
MYLLFNLTEKLPILFKADAMSIIFAAVTVIIFLCSGIFSLEYMKHEQKKKRFYVFYLLAFLILMGLCFAGNLITFYLFFEMLTLASTPLVLHNGSREANMAGLKYLFYSLCGAYMALFGLYFVSKYGNTLTFSEGGVINQELAAGHTGLLLAAAFVMILGFSVKAGMFPMHAWLSAAHPVAPAPASAVLSAVIVKAGVLGIIRVVYYIFGAAFLKGTWVQTAFMVLTLITVFMGSMLAYREPVLKKRLAYSTVSQVSYILFGLSAMDMNSVTGGVLHVIAHGFIKAALFLCAGAIIYMTGKTRVEELKGIGKEMPLLMWCYTIVSLGLIGIPPTGGFISKWYLAIGSLETGIPGFSWIGPVVLLVSALLTAGYLLPLTIQGFFPGEDYDYKALRKKEPSALMTVPVLILTVLTVLMGLFPGQLISWIQQAVTKLI